MLSTNLISTIAFHISLYAILALIILIILPALFAFTLSTIIPKYNKSILHLSISRLSLFPTYCQHFFIYLEEKSINISISFDSFSITINLMDINKNFIHIDFIKLHVILKNITYTTIMESSPADKVESLSSEIKKFIMKLISISIHDFSFEMKVADANGLLVKGGCKDFNVIIGNSSVGNSCVLATVNIDGGNLDIYQNKLNLNRSAEKSKNSNYHHIHSSDNEEDDEESETFFSLSTNLSEVKVDYEVFSRKMRINMTLKGENSTSIQLEQFLSFYTRYQDEEDKSLETKMIRTNEIDGKMVYIGGKCESMNISIMDRRVCSIMQMHMQEISGRLFTNTITDSPNKTKIIQAELGVLRWPGADAILLGMTASKELLIVNENDFLDIDSLKVHCQRASFVYLDQIFLRWMCILNDAVDRLPSSRFSHAKQSKMKAQADYVLFSYCPDINTNELSTDIDNNNSTKLVAFEFDKMLVCKSSEAYSLDSYFTMSSDAFEMRTQLSLLEFSQMQCINLFSEESSDSDCLACCLWRFTDFTVDFISGASFNLQSCRASSMSSQLSTTLSQDKYLFFDTHDLNVTWLLSYRINVVFTSIALSISSVHLVRFMNSFDLAILAINKLLGIMRAVKEETYGPTKYPPEPPLEILVKSSELRVTMTFSRNISTNVVIKSKDLLYSSLPNSSGIDMTACSIGYTTMDGRAAEACTFDSFSYCKSIDRSQNSSVVVDMNVTFLNMKVYIISDANFGKTVNGVLSLSDQYNLAVIRRRDLPLPTPPPIIYRLSCTNTFDIVFSSQHGSIVTKFIIYDFNIVYDCTSPLTHMIEDIRKNDIQDEIVYHCPSGGRIRLTFTSLKLFYSNAAAELILFQKVLFSGLLYSASVQHENVLLFEKDEPLPLVCSIDFPCCLRRLNRSAPSKFYGDLAFSVDEVHVTTSTNLSDCLSLSSAILSSAFASKEDKSESSLSIWDMIRYWWHGPLLFYCSRFKVGVIPNILNPSLFLIITMEQLKVSSTATTTEFRCYDFVISVRYKMKEIEALLETVPVASVPSDKERADLVILPAVFLSCEVAFASHVQPYRHHDVYLNPVEGDDAFAKFRIAPSSLDVFILGRWSGRTNEPAILMLRLDLIKVLTDAFNPSRESSEIQSQSSLSTEPSSVADSTSVLSLGRALNLHIHIDKFQAYSWPSLTNRTGFLFTQDRLDLQLRLRRSNDEVIVGNQIYSEYNGIVLERLYTEVHLVDIHVRDWPAATLPRRHRDGPRGSKRYKVEPDLKEFLLPGNRVVHATKLKISLMELDTTNNADARKDDFIFTPDTNSSGEKSSISTDFRPSIFNFAANHNAFVPSPKTLPNSYIIWRRNTENEHSLHSLIKTRLEQKSPLRRASQKRCFNNDEKSQKIWGLKIIDMRLLWSVMIRDNVFNYFSSYFSMFAGTEEANSADKSINQSMNSDIGDGKAPNPDLNRSSMNVVRTSEKASLQDFKRFPAGLLTQIKSSKDLGQVLPNKSSKRVYRVVQDLNMQKHFLSPQKIPEPTEERNISQGYNTVNISKLKSLRELGKSKSRASFDNNSPRRNSNLFSSRQNNHENMSIGSSSKSRSPYEMYPMSPLSPLDLNNSTTPVEEPFFLYFKIDLVDPQINFYDDKCEGSMICCTGVSSIEGRHQNVATVYKPDNQSDAFEAKRKNEIRLRMDNVSAFTASTNVDGENDVVHWKSVDSATVFWEDGLVSDKKKQSLKQNRAMKVAVEDFKVRSSYTFWTDITKKEAGCMRVIRTGEELVCSFKIDIPILNANIESDQFYILFNTVRNVMLAPPPVGAQVHLSEDKDIKKSKRREIKPDELVLLRYDLKLPAVLDINTKATRDCLKVLIEEFTKDPLEEELGIARFVECFIGGGRWILSSSEDGRPLVEAGFFGVNATYSFNEDRSTVSLLEVQRFWARSFASTPDFRNDVTFRTNVNDDKTSYILLPILNESEYCYRCKQHFKTTDNVANLCIHHADNYGNAGEYKENRVTDEITSQVRISKAWSCCGASDEDAKGCSVSPHMCKENMFSIRAEAYPESSINNIELTILQSLEISIFPGASYDLRVRITKALSDILHEYFSVDTQEVVQGPGGVAVQGHGGVAESRRYSSDTKLTRTSLFATPRKSNDIVDDDNPHPPSSTMMSPSRRRTPNTELDTKVFETPKKESFYFKYLRVGEINVDVSISGFTFNVDNYKAVVEPFVRRGEVMDWNRFVSLLEWHASWSLTVHTAASNFAKIGNLFYINNAQSSSVSSQHTEETAKELKKVEQLLGKLPASKITKNKKILQLFSEK